jgi:hypothetical protein
MGKVERRCHIWVGRTRSRAQESATSRSWDSGLWTHQARVPLVTPHDSHGNMQYGCQIVYILHGGTTVEMGMGGERAGAGMFRCSPSRVPARRLLCRVAAAAANWLRTRGVADQASDAAPPVRTGRPSHTDATISDVLVATFPAHVPSSQCIPASRRAVTRRERRRLRG